jgi:hypothetical protein
MIPGLERIVEERIQVSQKKGDFDNLPGAGRPLEFEDDSHVPEELRLPFKILKNADCLPPEIEIKKEIERTEDLLTGMSDTAERYRTMKRLNYLIFKLNSTRNSSVLMDVPQKYMVRFTERLEAKRSK